MLNNFDFKNATCFLSKTFSPEAFEFQGRSQVVFVVEV